MKCFDTKLEDRTKNLEDEKHESNSRRKLNTQKKRKVHFVPLIVSYLLAATRSANGTATPAAPIIKSIELTANQCFAASKSVEKENKKRTY